MGPIVEGGSFVHTVEMDIDEEKLESKLGSPTSADTYCAVSVRQLQAALCLLMLGYVLAVVCFVTEIMWQC